MQYSFFPDWRSFVGFSVSGILLIVLAGWKLALSSTATPPPAALASAIAPVSSAVRDEVSREKEPAPAVPITSGIERQGSPAALSEATSGGSPEDSGEPDHSPEVVDRIARRKPVAARGIVPVVERISRLLSPLVSPLATLIPTVDALAPVMPVSAVASNDVSKVRSQQGKTLFQRQWVPRDKRTTGDGLGPVFNGRSCAECHSLGGLGGAGTNEHSVQLFEILPSKAGAPVISGAIHSLATTENQHESVIALERFFRPGAVTAGERPSPNSELTNKQLIDATRFVWTNSPALWGLGRIDRLSAQELEPSEAKTALGRFRVLEDGRLGKFGWKAQFASLKEFVANACANELGLSNELAHQQVPCEFRPDPHAEHDLSHEQIEALTEFVASLPEPVEKPSRNKKQREFAERGKELIDEIGCTECHRRNLGEVKGVYSDYRLHRIEDTLNTSNEYYHQNLFLEVEPPAEYPRLDEWKTPALWGVADTAPYWHDGSVPSLEAAILRHAGEAQSSATKYRRLLPEDRRNILAFLDTLRAPTMNPVHQHQPDFSGNAMPPGNSP